MSILHRYLYKEVTKTVLTCSLGFCFLFMIFDFFDRIDNVLAEDPPLDLIFSYFLYKVPLFFTLTLPIATLVGTMLSIGLLSKKSEITAMRAAGLKLSYLVRPILALGLVLSIVSIAMNETVVPYVTRKQKEIYNIDIRKKDKKGTYGQSNFWWRSGDSFFSVDFFDSRDSRLLNLNRFNLDDSFSVQSRFDAEETHYVNKNYGWTSYGVQRFTFKDPTTPEELQLMSATLPIEQEPKDFYSTEIEPLAMSYLELKQFIAKQQENGVSSSNYFADLYAKISFPFVTLIVALAAIPFALRPARSGSLAPSFVAGLIIGFSYFVVHSFSLAMGRAEVWHPMVAAWSANILLSIIGVVLLLGAEAPE